MKWLDRLEELIVIVMLAAMTLLTFSQVVMRYVFNAGWGWALELTTVFFALMIFVGISYGVRVGAHIGVDALVKILPPAPRRAVSILSDHDTRQSVQLALARSDERLERLGMVENGRNLLGREPLKAEQVLPRPGGRGIITGGGTGRH
jgi:hypothetical protein